MATAASRTKRPLRQRASRPTLEEDRDAAELAMMLEAYRKTAAVEKEHAQALRDAERREVEQAVAAADEAEAAERRQRQVALAAAEDAELQEALAQSLRSAQLDQERRGTVQSGIKCSAHDAAVHTWSQGSASPSRACTTRTSSSCRSSACWRR